jgi:hypothetical protein
MKNLSLYFAFSLLLVSCGTHENTDVPASGFGQPSSSSVASSSSDVAASSSSSTGIVIETGRVNFFNASSYQAIVYKDFFPPAGIPLCTLSAGGSKSMDIRASDRDGIGSTFPIEYKYLIASDFNLSSGTVWANGIDPNVQINKVIEANKSHQIQIPQPQNLAFPKAYMSIQNASSLQFELNHLNTAYKQSGNGNLPVPPGKIGLYEIDATADGKIYSGWTVRTTFETTSIPDFSAKSGIIYNFTYTGNSVSLDSEQKITFNK